MDSIKSITPQTIREIAAEACVSYPSVKKWFQCWGVGMKPSIAERIQRSAERHGVVVPAKAVA